MPEMIVVGIGVQPEALEETQMRRNFDFSPTATPDYDGFGSAAHRERERAGAQKREAEGKAALDRFGGALRFLPFIVKEVRERLGEDYRFADNHTLLGHSGGGLFCAHALVSEPAAFDRYVCAYPSLKLHFRAFAGASHVSVIPPLFA